MDEWMDEWINDDLKYLLLNILPEVKIWNCISFTLNDEEGVY
jgi:hypothetical protein